jgi:hypothetical protein
MSRPRIQAGPFTDHAVHVLDRAAPPAHDVVVVVADSRLEERRTPGGLDPACQAGSGKRSQHVVHALRRHRIQTCTDLLGDVFDL